jgi:AsmA protein
MRKILIAIGVIVVLLIVAVLVAPFFIPIDWAKQQIIAQVKEQTGRDLKLDGDISVSLIPTTAVEVSDVSLSNRPGSDVADMIKLKDLELEVALFPLLSGELEVDRFVLIEPDIYLEVDEQGRGNWELGGTKAETTTEDTSTGTETGGSPTDIASIKLGDIRIENGRLTYADLATGETTVVSDLNVTVDLPDMQSPFVGSGSFSFQDQPVEFTIATGAPAAMNAGEEVDASFDLKSDPLTSNFKGTMSIGEGPKLSGDLDLQIPSLANLVAWVAEPLPADTPAPEVISIAGRLDLAQDNYGFSGATIKIDDMTTEGDMSVDLSGAKPMLVASLAVDQIDLNPYLGEGQAGNGGDGGSSDSGGDSGGSGGGAAAEGWSDEPIDFSALDLLNADLSLTTQSLTVQEIKIGPSSVDVDIADGSLNVNLKEMQLYEGTGTATIVLDRSGQVPQLAKTINIQGIQARPLMTDAAGFDKLAGTGAIQAQVTASGNSQKQMVETLNGDGSILFQDGAFYGINLAGMVRNFSLDALKGAISPEQKTDFAELSATFTITDGVVKNDDLLMSAPLLRVNGEGTVPMPPRTIDYLVVARAVASLEGQGGETDDTGVPIPLKITGSWNDPKVQPDMEAMAKGLLENPDALGEQIQQLEEGLTGGGEGGAGGLLEGLTGSGGDGESGSDSATEQLKSLFE